MPQNEILLVDGIRYCLWIPKDENELEESAKFHAKEVFGLDSIYFDVKKKIKSTTGEGTIPDGYSIDFNKKAFYIIEIELSTHHEYDHISKQIGKFINALKNYRTRQKIARILKDYIDEDIVRKKFVIDKIGDIELYQFFLEDILENVKEQNYQTIVIIDKITDKISEACSILIEKPKILEFRTFVRENVGDLRVHCHLFESLIPERKPKLPPEVKGEFITRHRSWGIKDDKYIYVNKVILKSGIEYRDGILKEEFIKIANAIYNFQKKNVLINRTLVTKEVYGEHPKQNRYWWVDNTMGILILEGFLLYKRGKAPQYFEISDTFTPEKIFNKIKA